MKKFIRLQSEVDCLQSQVSRVPKSQRHNKINVNIGKYYCNKFNTYLVEQYSNEH